MPQQIWPEDVKQILFETFGIPVAAPTGFDLAKKLSYFVIDCGDHTKAKAFRELLLKKRISAPQFVKTEFDFTRTAKHYGKLSIHIPKMLAAKTVLALCELKAEIQAILEQPTISHEEFLRVTAQSGVFNEPSRPTRNYADIFGRTVDTSPDEVPEITAKWPHLRQEDMLDQLMEWFPPQNPQGIMFYWNKEGKLDVATPEVRRELAEQYEAFVAKRQKRLDCDRMFDPQTNTVVQFNPGVIFDYIKNGQVGALGPATYWNPETKAWHLLTDKQLSNLKQNPQAGMQAKAQEFFDP